MLSTYKEFANRQDARRAARALRKAGLENVETEDLSRGLQSISDVDLPPPSLTRFYEAFGSLNGAVAGAGFGLLLFGLPAVFTGIKHGGYIVIIGTLVCTIAGAGAGLFEGCILAKRFSVDPTGRLGRCAVGVHVSADSSEQIIQAKAILTRFGERPQMWLRNRILDHYLAQRRH